MQPNSGDSERREVVRYDSRVDTYAHIAMVQAFMDQIVRQLMDRALNHDGTKLFPPERDAFDEFTPKLKDTTYGSAEYEGYRKAMAEALEHHYSNNSHHPEYWPLGFKDMGLLDLIEMLADWKAATMRHADGDLHTSINHNAERFGYDENMKLLLLNTAVRLGWITL